MRTGATRPQERALVPRRALASVVAPGARVSTDERLWVVGVALAEHLLTWYLGMARTWLLLVTPNTHERVTQGANVHSSIQAPSVVAEERVKVESPQRSEENRP
jgi:hypothetical protein